MSGRILVTPRSLTAPHIGGSNAEGGREAVRVAVAGLIACLARSKVAAGAGAR